MCGICQDAIDAQPTTIETVETLYGLLDTDELIYTECTANHAYHANCVTQFCLYYASHKTDTRSAYPCPLCRGDFTRLRTSAYKRFALPDLRYQSYAIDGAGAMLVETGQWSSESDMRADYDESPTPDAGDYDHHTEDTEDTEEDTEEEYVDGTDEEAEEMGGEYISNAHLATVNSRVQ